MGSVYDNGWNAHLLTDLASIFVTFGYECDAISSTVQMRDGEYSGMIVLIWHSLLRLPVALVSHAKYSLGISLSYPVIFFDIK